MVFKKEFWHKEQARGIAELFDRKDFNVTIRPKKVIHYVVTAKIKEGRLKKVA
jgi:hypothetical protein